MLYFFSGGDDYLVAQAARKHRIAFASKYPDARIKSVDADELADLGSIRQQLTQGGGLFSQQSYLLIKNIQGLKADGQAQLQQWFMPIVAQDETTVVVTGIFTKEKTGKLGTFLKKHATHKNFSALSDLQLHAWINTMIADQSNGKVTMDPTALSFLVHQTNRNMWLLDQEIAKLITYRLEGKITKQEVQTLCSGTASAKVFDLIDAIGAKQKAGAYQLLYQLITHGENEFGVFAMITYQLRTMLRISDQTNRGNRAAETIATGLKIHPFVVKKTLRQLQLFSLQSLRGLFDLATKLDYEVKVGQRQMNDALIYFIARI